MNWTTIGELLDSSREQLKNLEFQPDSLSQFKNLKGLIEEVELLIDHHVNTVVDDEKNHSTEQRELDLSVTLLGVNFDIELNADFYDIFSSFLQKLCEESHLLNQMIPLNDYLEHQKPHELHKVSQFETLSVWLGLLRELLVQFEYYPIIPIIFKCNQQSYVIGICESDYDYWLDFVELAIADEVKFLVECEPNQFEQIKQKYR